MSIYLYKLIIINLCLVILLLFVVRLYISVGYTTAGADLQKIQDRIGQVRKGNSVLKESVNLSKSFENIEARAREMGFVNITKDDIIYIR